MADRQPEPCESSAPGAFLRIERAHGAVEVWALGEDRYSVKAPEPEQLAVGFDAPRRVMPAFTTPDVIVLTHQAVDAGTARDIEATISLYAPDAVRDLSSIGIGTW